MGKDKEKKLKEKDQKNLTKMANEEFDQVEIVKTPSRREVANQAEVNRKKAMLVEKIRSELDDLSKTAIDKRCDQVQKAMIKDAVLRCNSLKIFDNLATAETVCSFLLKDIRDAKSAINQGNYLAINAQLSTIKETLEHAAETPYFYKNEQCVKILISRNKAVSQKNIYQAEVFNLTEQIKSYMASYDENPDRYKAQMNLFAQELKTIQNKIDNKTKLINEVNSKIEYFDYALDSVRIAAENRDSGITFDIDEIVKVAELSKEERESFKEKMAESLSSIKQDNSKVSNDAFAVDDSVQSTSSKSQEEVEDIFKMYR
ncbi:MAG: hypothetical protein K6E20_06535 [Acholeplasmatales bacterium]|nr:hypothetical protein [Acholeplasmatales bacterium]